MKLKDFTGQKFNSYTFLVFDSRKKSRPYWLCRCDCGTEKVVRASDVVSGNVKSCGCLNREDLTNQRFNKLVFLYFCYRTNDGKGYWLCLCDCGNICITESNRVKSGNTKSCGCLNNHENLINIKYAKLLVIDFDSVDKYGQTHWLCLCDCGNNCVVVSSRLKSGHTKSCGCYNRSSESKLKGENHPGYRHDLSKKEREDSKNRTLNPKTKKWRAKVFKRDNYVCQVCNQRGRKLAAHHIFNWWSHKKLRFVTSNGATLCKKCHKEFHHRFGTKYNTRKQFNKFKRDYKNDNQL